MSVFTPAPHGLCGKDELEVPPWAEGSCSTPRAGLGPPRFPSVAPGKPRAGKCTRLVPSSGTRTRKGPWLFYIYYFHYYYGVLQGYMPVCRISRVGCEWPPSRVGDLQENKKLGILVEIRMHRTCRYFCQPNNRQFGGKIAKESNEQNCHNVLYKNSWSLQGHRGEVERQRCRATAEGTDFFISTASPQQLGFLLQ